MNIMGKSVVINSSSGTRELSLESVHLSERRVFLLGEITSQMANDVIMQLLWLQDEGDAPISMYINSPGGDVVSGLAIYDVMQTLEVPVYTYCLGNAVSMASLILTAGQQGQRYIYPHSRVMIHCPYIAGGVGGTAGNIQDAATRLLKTQTTITEIYAAHTGHTIDEVAEAIKYDHFMTAEEAVAFGLCDQIYGNYGLEENSETDDPGDF